MSPIKSTFILFCRVGLKLLRLLIQRLLQLIPVLLLLMQSALKPYFRVDKSLAALVAGYLLLFAPLVSRNTDNPQLLAAFVNDEPFLTMALEATLRVPFGNPGNYFDYTKKKNFNSVPDHWGDLKHKYTNIIYYGGGMYQLTWLPYAALRSLGFPAFPTGPIILRWLSLLAGLGSLVFIYNFCRMRGSRLAGACAFVYIVCDGDFLYYALHIHPDTLQMLLGLCCLALAVAHVKDGRILSLFALGLSCGFVQGTKVGGPWLIPAALLALWLGRQSSVLRAGPVGIPWRGELRDTELVSRCGYLGVAGLLGYFLASPHAFTDDYYFRSMKIAFGAMSQDSIDPTNKATLLSWAKSAFGKSDWLGWVLIAAATARTVAVNFPRVTDPASLFAATLAASQLLYFGATSKLWIVLGYLVLGHALTAALAFEFLFSRVPAIAASLVARLATMMPKTNAEPKVTHAKRALNYLQPARISSVFAIIFLLDFIFMARWQTVASVTNSLRLTAYSTVNAANTWAQANRVPRDARIIFDDLAYFDPKIFTKAHMHGGVLTWSAIETTDPEYIVLSSSLYDAAWAKALRASQRVERIDQNSFNMRLYQELLASDVPGKTAAPGVDLIEIIRPVAIPPLPGLFADLRARFKNYCEMQYQILCSMGRSRVATTFDIMAAHQATWLAMREGIKQPVVGPELRIFRVNKFKSIEGRPGAFAEGTSNGAQPWQGFTGGSQHWACEASNLTGRSCILGYDFGHGAETRVGSVQVTWADATRLPDRIAIEYSGNNVDWHSATEATPSKTANEATYAVPNVGPHRSWRIRAIGSSSNANAALNIRHLAFKP